MIRLIGINDGFRCPLGLTEFCDIVEYAECKESKGFHRRWVKKGYWFGLAKIIELCGISCPEEYGLCVGRRRKEKAEASRKKKEKIIQRITEMVKMPGMDQKKMLRKLEDEGFKISMRTLRNYLRKAGICWQDEKKKQVKENEHDFERD